MLGRYTTGRPLELARRSLAASEGAGEASPLASVLRKGAPVASEEHAVPTEGVTTSSTDRVKARLCHVFWNRVVSSDAPLPIVRQLLVGPLRRLELDSRTPLIDEAAVFLAS